MATIQQIQGTMFYISSYNFDSLQEFSANYTRKFRLNLFTTYGTISFSNLLTRKDFNSFLNKRKYRQLFTLKENSPGKIHPLQTSLEYFRKSNDSKIEAFKLFRRHGIEPPRHSELLSNIFLDFGELTEKRLHLIQEVLSPTSPDGSVHIHDPLFSKGLTIKPLEIFNPENPHTRDLKLFMARVEDFSSAPGRIEINGEMALNYRYGQIEGQSPNNLKSIFPTVSSHQELMEAYYLIQRSNIGFPLFFWIGPFI